MKKIYLFALGCTLLSSCSDKKDKPSIVYMPDMYYSTAYDPYQKATAGYPHDKENSDVPVVKDNTNMSALEPVEGTVPRNEGDFLPWTLKNNNEGYAQSKTISVSPLKSSDYEKNLESGKKLYKQNCAVCHGDLGDGKGSIVNTKAYSGVPTYGERDITVGSVYHVIMYGKNAMGSYSHHLTPEDRWKVAEYVMFLKNGEKNNKEVAAETTEVAIQ